MTSDQTASLAEEAAKLFASIQQWAQRDGATAFAAAFSPPAQDQMHEGEAEATGQHTAADHTAEEPRNDTCRYCPICALMRAARATSPEVRAHLTAAALSLSLAVKSLLDDQLASPAKPDPVEKINVEGDEDGTDE